MKRVRAAKELLPGQVVWPNGADPARVLAVLPTTDSDVVVFTESGGIVGNFSSAPEDGYHTHTCTAQIGRAHV